MKNYKNLLMRCPALLAAGLISLQSMSTFAQCTNDLAVPSSLFGSGFNGDGNFNVIVLGDYSAVTGTSDGRLAVGGNFTLNSPNQGFSVGGSDQVPDNTDNFIVNGTYTNRSGQVASVKGNFHYGSLNTQTPLPTITGTGTSTSQTGRLDFSGLQQHYTGLSAGYASLPATSSPDPISSGASLTLTGDNTIRNYVFNVTFTESNVTAINFVNIPQGSGILINVLNTSLTMTGGGTPMVSTYATKTLFNFPNAVNILVSGFIIQGGILAPGADLTAAGNPSAIQGPVVVGGDISQAGTFNFNNTCFTYPLPVRLAEFKAHKEGGTTQLSWKTSSESNADHFTVERRVKESAWTAIGMVNAKGESDELLNYVFPDRSPLGGDNLYRLKMTDLDGTYAYSSVVSANFELILKPILHPNPTTDYITFTERDWRNITGAKVLNPKGKVVLTQTGRFDKIEINSLSAGLYLLQITTVDGRVSTRRFIKK
ncbi:MAG TPA: choice-of-anchor A family protein [Dyadobacter sp.]|jgi:choice-of-anchor A domain-containing protein|nr:choice-of-anchor A family protein [Dyadobacter sp.]